MSVDQKNWVTWVRTLQRWGMGEAVASMIEAAGSLGVLVAQVLYISQPLLSGTISPQALHALAQVLENPTNRQEFATFLREAPSGGSGA